MKDLYRFYDNVQDISGVCWGNTKEEATQQAKEYLEKRFSYSDFSGLVVWLFVDDDDFEAGCDAIAVNYV